MRDFKFFEDNKDDEYVLADSTPTWMWDAEFGMSEIEGYTWVLDTMYCYGILEFLSSFPDYYIVPVHSIMGNGITHTYNSEPRDDGWGFNIRREDLRIQYYRLLPNDEV